MALRPAPFEACGFRVTVVRACGFVAMSGWHVVGSIRRRWGLAEAGDGEGTLPRGLAGQARHAAEDEGQDGLARGGAWQVQLDLGFHLDDAHGQLDQAQPQGGPLAASARISTVRA